jgi:hypothetical protein
MGTVTIKGLRSENDFLCQQLDTKNQHLLRLRVALGNPHYTTNGDQDGLLIDFAIKERTSMLAVIRNLRRQLKAAQIKIERLRKLSPTAPSSLSSETS